jgi:UDP-2,3-diacylglucosamine hydrolase
MTEIRHLPDGGETLFVSDVHLGAGRAADDAARGERLLAFLSRRAAGAARLFVLGDLFDFWFEYRHAVPKEHLRVLWALARLEEAGTAVTFFGGNHDFWAGPYLAREFGFEVFDAPARLEVGGRQLALMHGDGLAKGDLGYKMLKGVLRNPLAIAAYRAIHPDVGIPLARWASSTSRHSRDESKVDREWLYRQLALPRFADGADAVLTGHYHHPTHFVREGRDFLVLGDWVMHSTFARLADGRFGLWAWDGAAARPWSGPGIEVEATP